MSLRIRLYVPRIRDYRDPFLFFLDGIGTRKFLFDREGSGFLGCIYLLSSASGKSQSSLGNGFVSGKFGGVGIFFCWHFFLFPEIRP